MALNHFLPRFAIRHLLIGTAFIGFACVSLKNASQTWVTIAFAVTLATLAAATLLAIFRQRKTRAWWIGFATLDCLYLALLMYSLALEPTAAPSNPLASQNLATARLSRFVHEKLYPQTIRQNQVLMRLGAPGVTSNLQLSGQVTIMFDQATGGINLQSTTGTPARTARMQFITGPPAPFTGTYPIHFINVAHAHWTLLLASLGGAFAWLIYTTKPKSAAPTPTP